MTQVVRKSFHDIPVESADEEPVDFRVHGAPPPWFRYAQAAISIGGVLLVLAVILFTAVVAERFELMQNPDPPPARAGNR